MVHRLSQMVFLKKLLIQDYRELSVQIRCSYFVPPFLKGGWEILALKQKGVLGKILKGVPLLKGGAGKVKINFLWPNSRIKILVSWAFLGIQEMQNSKFSPNMMKSCPNRDIPFSLFLSG